MKLTAFPRNGFLAIDDVGVAVMFEPHEPDVELIEFDGDSGFIKKKDSEEQITSIDSFKDFYKDIFDTRLAEIKAEEEAYNSSIEKLKADRSNAVSRITVEVDGLLFDGDETSQDRMARAVANARAKADMVNAQRKADWMASWGDADSADGIPEEPAYDDYLEYETTWILATNEVRTDIKISQLAQALVLAGQKQTELWVKPYAGADVGEVDE